MFICFSLIAEHAVNDEFYRLSFIEMDDFLISHSLPKSVEIRGFLYEIQDHQFILASEPNIKSCCLGRNIKQNQQILLAETIEGIDDSHYPVTLRGILTQKPNESFSLMLSKILIVDTSPSHQNSLFTPISVVLASCLAFWCFFRKLRH